MIRCILGLGIVVSMAAVAGAVDPGDAPVHKPPSKLEGRAQHVFAQADADNSHALDPAEQAQSDLLAEQEIHKLIADHTIGGRKILPPAIEPKLADRDAVTVAEFSQHFQSLAAKKDATLRTFKIANRRQKRSVPQIDSTGIADVSSGGQGFSKPGGGYGPGAPYYFSRLGEIIRIEEKTAQNPGFATPYQEGAANQGGAGPNLGGKLPYPAAAAAPTSPANSGKHDSGKEKDAGKHEGGGGKHDAGGK